MTDRRSYRMFSASSLTIPRFSAIRDSASSADWSNESISDGSNEESKRSV